MISFPGEGSIDNRTENTLWRGLFCYTCSSSDMPGSGEITAQTWALKVCFLLHFQPSRPQKLEQKIQDLPVKQPLVNCSTLYGILRTDLTKLTPPKIPHFDDDLGNGTLLIGYFLVSEKFPVTSGPPNYWPIRYLSGPRNLSDPSFITNLPADSYFRRRHPVVCSWRKLYLWSWV